jgi:glycosyltransferase involved in cell wall biosynthesis
MTEVAVAYEAAVEAFDVSIVLPCLNEEESVGLCVREALNACEAAGLSAEVVVVDNNCTDGSANVARAAGARVVPETTAGYGAAIRAGIATANGKVVVMADADCTYPLDRVSELVRPVLDGRADMMIGSRLDAATARSMPFLHRFVGTPTLTYLVREGSGAPLLTDSQSGYRAFRRDVILSLGLSSTGMEFASEMLMRAMQQDLRIQEISLGYRQRVGHSKLNTWSDGMRHLRLIVRLSPHLMLWYPGQVLVAAALVLFGVSLAAPAKMSIGSATWQPVFFSSTVLVFGLGGMLSGAVLAHHSHLTSGRVHNAFSWVGEARVLRRMRTIGSLLALAGIGLDLGLFVASVRRTNLQLHERITLSGLAQSMLLAGTLLAVFSVLYGVIATGRAAQVRAEGCAPRCGS